VRLERGRLVDDGAARQLGDAVNPERADEHHAGARRARGDRVEEVLRGVDGAVEDLRGGAAHRRGDVEHRPDAVEQGGRAGDRLQGAGDHRGACARVPRQDLVEATSRAPRAERAHHPPHASREQAIDQRGPEEAVRAGDEDLQRVTHFHSWVRRGAARSKSRHR
jgi:hypothetical protein